MVKKQRRNSFYVPSLPPLGASKPPARPPLPGAHFLENVNLNGNLLDIPDPPSPPKRNARRQSLPLLRPLPLHDRTNEETTTSDDDNAVICHNNGNNEAATSTTASAAAATVTTNKRSRKSLCHVPSPVMESHQNGMNPAQQEPQESSLICFDDDDDDDDIFASKRQKRRESMILPSNRAPMKHEDFSKDSIMNDDGTSSSESSTNTANVEHGATNKRRLSIVLPSDIASFQQQVTTKLLECTAETNDEDTTVSFQQDKTPRMATRRQSMMLPTDALVLQDTDANEYFEHLHTVQTNESNPKLLALEDKEATEDSVELEATVTTTSTDETAASNNTETAPKVSSFNHIATLVREYCSLPQSQRHDSKQAQEIERLTGYALIPPAAKTRAQAQAMPSNWMDNETDTFVSSQNDVAAAKRELLLKLGDMVDVMDKRKTLDTAELEETTQCRVERSRNGKYRYFDIVTNRKVRPLEYEKLYLAAIQQTRAQMSIRIQEWLRQNETMSEQEKEEEEQCEKLAALIQSSTQHHSNDQSVQEHEEMGPPAGLHDGAGSESDMEESPASESSESMDLDKQSDSSLGQVTVEQARDETKDASCMEQGDTSMLSLEDVPKKDEPRTVSDSRLKDDTDESSELLVPFPSRQDTSDDPEIATAEERLWSEIDQALERYSRQVVAIRQARACERKDAL